MILSLYYFVSNVLTSTRCTYFIMRDRVLAQKEYPAYSLFKLDFFKRFNEACRTTPAIGIVNDRLEEPVRIEMLMKTATSIVE